MTCRIRLMTCSQVRRVVDKLSTSITLSLIKQIDLKEITAALGSSKLRGCVNKAEKRKEFHKHWRLMSEPEKRKSIPWPQEGATVVYVKDQITITFTRLLQAYGSIIWAETTYYRAAGYGRCLLVSWSFCRTNGVCHSILEKMKWHHLLFVLEVMYNIEVEISSIRKSTKHSRVNIRSLVFYGEGI